MIDQLKDLIICLILFVVIRTYADIDSNFEQNACV